MLMWKSVDFQKLMWQHMKGSPKKSNAFILYVLYRCINFLVNN